MKNILILALVILLSSCEKAPIVAPSIYACDLAFTENSIAHPKAGKFQLAMEEIKGYVPGVQVAVRSKDGNVWLGAQGLADIPNKVPYENCTKTMIGSASKMYTATLIMQLQEDNILSIEDPISKWLDAAMIEQIENADQVNIRQLLNHTSGIRDYLSVEHHINSLNTPNYKLSPTEKMAYIYGKPADNAPDAHYTYSNSNYVLLGLIIEKARAMSYAEAIVNYINTPLGLQNTLAGTTENPIPSGTARPYFAVRNGKYTDIMPFSVSDAATGDGAMATNMQEALLFIEGLFKHTLVSEETMTQMMEENVKMEGPDLFGEGKSAGLGLEHIVHPQYGSVIGHSGSTTAYWSHVFHYPESQVTIAVAFNGDTNQVYEYEQLQKMIITMVDIAFE